MIDLKYNKMQDAISPLTLFLSDLKMSIEDIMNFYSSSFFLSAHHRESMVSRPKYEIVPFF